MRASYLRYSESDSARRRVDEYYPFYAQMEDDKEYFRQAIREGFFSEDIELVRDSLVVDWDQTKLVELSEITQAETKEQSLTK